MNKKMKMYVVTLPDRKEIIEADEIEESNSGNILLKSDNVIIGIVCRGAFETITVREKLK